MLTSNNFFKFGSNLTSKATIRQINKVEWLAVNQENRGMLLSCGNGGGPTPPDYFLLSLASCQASGIRFLLEKRGKKVKGLTVDVEAEWDLGPRRKFKEIRLNYTIEADEVSQELADQVIENVEKNMCVVGQTLKYKPNITLID